MHSLLVGMIMGKAKTVWFDAKTLEMIFKIRQYIEERNIEVPNIAVIEEFKGKLNFSMIVRYCVEQTLKQLEQ